MSIKTETTIQVFDKEENGSRITLTIQGESPSAILTVGGINIPVKVASLGLLESFFMAVMEDEGGRGSGRGVYNGWRH